MRILVPGAVLIGFIAVFGLVKHYRPLESTAPHADLDGGSDSGRRPVVVELFTSEGCSSCPPADALLSRLQDSQPVPGVEIITLSEHVDYWNHLGWKDPYSGSQFSARQQRYAEIFGGKDVYTPQMIVDGQKAFVGSNESEARAAITRALESAAANVTMAVENTSPPKSSNQIELLVQVDGWPPGLAGKSLDVLLAITESGLRSSVRTGENGGRTLLHTSVVRKLSSIGDFNPKAGGSFKANPVIRIDHSWQRDRLRAVVFVQDKSSLRIVGAASLDLAAAVDARKQ